MSSPSTTAFDVKVTLPESLPGPLHQVRSAKNISDDELVSTCVTFCLRLLLDTQVDLGKGTHLAADLHRALVDVRAVRQGSVDALVSVEKSLADVRTMVAALQTRKTS